MNIFRLSGDMMHLGSIFIILLKVLSQKNCKGISLKTQFLYFLVFITRYVDLFYNFSSLYNYIMKIIFILTSFLVCYFMKFKSPYKESYDKKSDNFQILYIIIPCALLGILTCYLDDEFFLTEILWTFSIYLEAIAIIPQLFVVHENARTKGGWVENLTSHYVFTLGSYRALYIANWIYRFATETYYRDWIPWVSGVIQTIIYCDFFYYYIKARTTGAKMTLPI